MIHLVRTSAAFASWLALVACSSEPDSTSSGPEVPAYSGLGGPQAAPSPATPAGPAANGTGATSSATGSSATGNGETTQINQLAPAGSNGNGAGSAPTPAVTNPTPPAAAPPPPQQMQPAPTPPANMQPAPTPTPTPAPPGPVAAGSSPGCGASQGMPASPSIIADPNTIVTFPNGYNGSTPFPLLFAFHGAGRTNQQMREDDSQTPGSTLEGSYVMAFVKSSGNAWDLATDYPRFQRVFTQLLNERCIDTAHVFAMGHSSGAQFLVSMLGDARARESRFAAVVPVSSSLLNNQPWTPLPTLLIHGLRDTQRMDDLNGAKDISQYARANQCPGTTQDLDIGTCTSRQRPQAVDPGCVSYQGCAQPTLFCNHNDPFYADANGDTNHGWPCFANAEIFRFLESVP